MRLVPAAALGWIAAAWCVGQSSVVALVVTAACVLVAVVVARHPVVVVTACLVGAVSASTAWQIAAVEGSPLGEWAAEGVTVDAVVEVTTDARTYRAPGGEGIVLSGSVREASSRLGGVVDGGTVTLFLSGDAAAEVEARALTVGRTVQVSARASPAEDTDEVAVLRVVDLQLLPGVPWWWAMSEHVRAGVRGAVSHEPLAPRALVPALVDGDDAAIPEDLEEDFRRSGLTHLLAVSGTNLTIVLASVLAVARAVGIRRRWWSLLAVLAVVGFVLVARPEPSVLRAAAMGLVGVVALGVGAAGGVRALSFAVLALLAIDPWLGRSPGFVLSVCATAGIVVLAPLFVERLRWCPRWIAVAIAVPLAAQVACTPALVALSGEVSLVAVLANLLAGPAVAPTTVAGLLGGLLWLVVEPLGSMSGTVAAAGARWIVAVGRTVGGWEGAAVEWDGPWWLSVVALPVSVAVLWWLLRRPTVALGMVLALVVVVWRPPSPGWPPEDWVLVACPVFPIDSIVLSEPCCADKGGMGTEKTTSDMRWRVHWVRTIRVPAASDIWSESELNRRERDARIRPGSPFMQRPDGSTDGEMTAYFRSAPFSRLAEESKRSYASDYRTFFNFLHGRAQDWKDATVDDIEDFEDWRRRAPENPRRIGGAKWMRELAALHRLYRWASAEGVVVDSPIRTVQRIDRRGGVSSRLEAAPRDVRTSNVKWLTPRAARQWRDVGVLGLSANGLPDLAYRGRNADRNAAFVDLLFDSGLRRSEAGSLLRLEVPEDDGTSRFQWGRVARSIAKYGSGRPFCVTTATVGRIRAYVQINRATAVRRAQVNATYADMADRLDVVHIRTGRVQVIEWIDARSGSRFERPVDRLALDERRRLFVTTDSGIEPLWLWLSEDGRPLQPHSWEAIFADASARCERVLGESAPRCTPHMARHSFALIMLLALHHALDVRFGLEPHERRDFAMLYGDPWRMVKDLLGHRSEETTRNIYLAPVRDVQIRTLLEGDLSAGTAFLEALAAASGLVQDVKR